MAFKAKNCPKCGNIFIDTGRHMCADCYQDLQLKATEVCSYIRDNPNASAEEVVEATGITMAMFRQMARDGYFGNESVTYPCKKCGKPIIVGVMCNECLGKIQKNLKLSMNAIDARKKLMQLDKGGAATYRTIRNK